MAPVVSKPTVTGVGLFIKVSLIADSRAEAIRSARRVLDGEYKIVDLAQATAQSADEWLVEVRVVAR